MQTALQVAANEVWAGLQGIAKVTQFGIEVREQIDLDDFRKAFGLLLFLDSRYKVFINFALGDLYNALDLKHGEKKAQILDTWGEGWYRRLNSLGGIASRIPKSCRQDFKLDWHVYESFALKSIPQEVRITGLETAAKMKERGQYVTRETLRHSVDPYRQPKPEQPKWNNGEGGRFGAEADKAEKAALPKRETKPLEPDNTPDVFQGAETPRYDARPGVHPDCICHETIIGKDMCPVHPKNSEDLSDLIPREGLVSEEPQKQAEWHYIDGDVEELLRRREEHIKQVEAENTSLKAKLAGNLIEISSECLDVLDKEVERRRLKSQYRDATLSRDTVGEDCILRGVKEFTRSR